MDEYNEILFNRIFSKNLEYKYHFEEKSNFLIIDNSRPCIKLTEEQL